MTKYNNFQTTIKLKEQKSGMNNDKKATEYNSQQSNQ